MDAAVQAKMDELYAALATDDADDKSVFEAAVAPVAAEAGLPFTYEEALEAHDGKDLDDDQLADAAGGEGLCFVWGFSDQPEFVGNRACAYIGITFGR